MTPLQVIVNQKLEEICEKLGVPKLVFEGLHFPSDRVTDKWEGWKKRFVTTIVESEFDPIYLGM